MSCEIRQGDATALLLAALVCGIAAVFALVWAAEMFRRLWLLWRDDL